MLSLQIRYVSDLTRFSVTRCIWLEKLHEPLFQNDVLDLETLTELKGPIYRLEDAMMKSLQGISAERRW